MDRKLEDIQKVSSAIFGEDNVDISIDKDVYIITISGTILLSQLEELSKDLNVRLLLNGRSPRIDRKYECSRIDVVIPT